MIDLQIDVDDQVSASLGSFADQLPFAVSVAINNTLNDAQTAIQGHVKDTFILRQADFIERTVYIAPTDRAKKDNLQGTVRINPARDFLAKFEDDTTKLPTRSATLAVPILRADDRTQIISRGDPYNVKKLMAALQTNTHRIRRRKGETGAIKRVYLLKARDGKTYLIEAQGSTSRVLYVFEPSVPIQPDLRFKEIAMDTALRMWDQRASEAIDFAIATAR